MSEAQAAPVSNPRGRGRGGRGRGFRSRGRGAHRGSAERNEEGTASDVRQATERGNTPVPGASSEVSNSAPARNEDSGFPQRRGGGRGGRARRANGGHPGGGERAHGNARTDQAASAPVDEAPEASSVNGDEGSWRRRRGRGGISGQRSVVVSHRGRGRPTPAAAPSAAGGLSASGLSADAVEFVPRQPVASPSLSAPKPAVPRPQAPKRRMSKSSAADLPARIQEDILNGQYECVICTNEVVRTSRVWSCSTCWTVAHLHCVKKWYTNQMKAKDENQHPNQPDGWRCPGCNSSLTEDPGPYHCWCGKEHDPKPIPGLPPHTCGQTCSKIRGTCPHPCQLMCHAGPCPPCTLMGPTQTCFCGKHTITKRCTESEHGKGWGCEEPCGDLLPCGEHTCTRPCHPGLCGACEVPVLPTCYCGKEQREIPCGQREDILESFNYGQLKASDHDAEPWFEGSFHCSSICGREFDCGHHSCQKPCHAQDEDAAHCPFSPDVVTHCPCGKTSLASMADGLRQTCRDPIPHCEEPCGKTLPCGHSCENKCHTGPCAPCFQYMDISCRCGRTTVHGICHQGNVDHPLCFRTCKAQLNCGRHECGEHCCAGEKKAAERRKQKRSANINFEAEHICLQICGRQLKCGKHACQQLCHRGPCQSCPEAVFDEIACSCGRTVLQPPQPCGTKAPECRFQCTRPRPCGHPTVNHQCHPEETPCPKCPFLVEKPCICGKKVLKNQPCWFEEARCGLPCGKKLKCGTHECRKPCHKPGECEDAGIVGSHCPQPCGKARKSCEHMCLDTCHAPFPCKEDRPCESKTFITCPCQNHKQEVRCLATRFNPWSTRETTLKCDDECLRLQRNRRLAEALDIDPETHLDDHIPYSDTTMKLCREDPTWAQTQEREFRVFASSPAEKRLRFKPMPANKRAFLHNLAKDFGLDSESEDPEPHRHVCIFKTPRFVSAPHKTLAQCMRILKNQAASAAAVAPRSPATLADRLPTVQPFNAFLLRDPRFGLTIEELEQALAVDLASVSRSGSAVKFTTNFLPSDEIVVRATPIATVAAVATSLTATPQSIETALSGAKQSLAKTVSRLGIAGAVELCHTDASLNVTRKEGDTAASASGWNAVAGRGSWRRPAVQPKALPASTPGRFVALKKLGKKAKESEKVEVEDWLEAVEKEEREQSGKSGDEETRGESGGEAGAEAEENIVAAST